MKPTTIYTTLLCLLFFNSLYSQTPDNSFSTNGKTVINYWSEYLEISSVLHQGLMEKLL